MEPDTWAAACCAASRRRDGPCARSPAGRSSYPDVDAVRGDLLTGEGLDGSARGLLHRLLPGPFDGGGRGEWRLRRSRSPDGRALRRGRGPSRSGADRLPGRHRPRGPAALAAPPIETGGRGDPALGRPRLHRSARVHRHRRGVVLLSHPRASRGATPGPSDASLALESHAADRRARRGRVPRPHAGCARRRRQIARRGGPRRDDLRPHDRANRRRDGGRARCPSA